MSWPIETVPVGSDEPACVDGPIAGRSVRQTARRAGLRVGVLAASGLVVGSVWRLVTPWVAARSDGLERLIAGEVTLAGLGLLAGIVVGVIDLLRRGRTPTIDFLVSLIGTGLGSLVAWRLGLLTGLRPILATGVLVAWPFGVAATTVLATLTGTLMSPDMTSDS
jgi:hypothetical protein